MNDSKIPERPGYWKSFKELNEDPESFEIKANEFMQEVTGDFDVNKLSGISRRKFLALLSASSAFAAASCTNYKDKDEIIAYNKRPDEIIPGIANYYASTCTGCAQSCGILIKTREGRPIKIDGNPDHPVNKGKICSIGQANILNLYDPNRLKKPVRVSGNSKNEASWKDIDDEIISELSKSADKEIALITHTVLSPTEKKVLDDFVIKYPNTKIYSYELFNDINRQNAWIKSYGSGLFPVIRWDKAKVIVSLDADFLGNEGNTVENIRLFAQNRDVANPDSFNRLYVIEGAFTLTGMNSDYRMRLRPDAQIEFVSLLINEIGKKIGVSQTVNSNSNIDEFVKKYGIKEKYISNLVSDLIENRGTAVVYAGNSLSEDVHVAVNYLNEILGNKALYDSEQSFIKYSSYTTREDWENLINNMKNDNTAVVIHYSTNPVYHLPPDYDYENALKMVQVSISLSLSENETSEICKYSLPINHDLESWGDFRTRTGFYSLQQPVINSIFYSRQKEAVLLTWIQAKSTAVTDDIYHKYLMKNWEANIFPLINPPVDFQTYWYSSLEAGVVKIKEQPSQLLQFRNEVLNQLNPKETQNDYVLQLRENYHLGDGEFVNNGWLQELPHPVTKVVWDNYAAISPQTAKELNVDNNDLIEISANNRKKEFPVFVQPGMADRLVVIELGYGRTTAGEVGSGVGFNANILMSKNSPGSKLFYNNVSVNKTSGNYKIVTAQEHHSLDDLSVKDLHKSRGIIREGTLNEFKSNPDFLHVEKGTHPSITPQVVYTGVKWGMSIDLNKCIGCTQCVAACNVENNIPVVGKDQVDRGREMHWIRVDRYYSGTPEEPVTSNQIMLCQHCDNAPCENVCPVVATTHSPDGLNQMVYNRCVGTRYCSNNCPYKVRRFNFFDFRDHFADGYYYQEPFDLQRNPEVTVRSRGVMEKCTFCIQRIMEARENAAEAGIQFTGKDVKTACQEACPANAIEFGNVNDTESKIAKLKEHELGYGILEELNTKPNVTYIAKLRNTFPEEA